MLLASYPRMRFMQRSTDNFANMHLSRRDAFSKCLRILAAAPENQICDAELFHHVM